MASLFQDLRFSLRTLWKSRWVSAVAVVSLAIAIGGNTAVFGMINGLIYRPLPYHEADRIVIFQERERTTSPTLGTFTTSLQTFADLSERCETVQDVAAFSPRTLNVQGTDRAEAVTGAAVTESFFRTLGVGAQRGRVFLPEEAVEGGRKVVLLRHEYWVRTMGLDRNPIGEILSIGGEPHEVVGVLPQGFDFLAPNVDLWVPLAWSPRSEPRTLRAHITLARLSPSANMAQAQAEAAAVGEQLASEFPEAQGEWVIDVFNLRHDLPTGRSRALFVLLQATVFSVLLIACLNITNLLLARGLERRQELAVRAALGAGRRRLIRQLLSESSILALVGGVGGVALGWYGIRVLSAQLASNLPESWSPVLDGRVLFFTLGCALLAGLMFGIAPALGAGSVSLSGQLNEGGLRTTGGQGRKRLGRALVVGEIALCLVALGGGGLLARSLSILRDQEPGFERAGLLTAQVSVPSSKYADEAEARVLSDRMLEAVRNLQGVRSASFTSVLPMGFLSQTDTFRVEAAPAEEGLSPPRAFVVLVSPTYRQTLGVPVLEGRFFDEQDRMDNRPVAVVSQTLVEAQFGHRSPIGERIGVRGKSREIVGVLGRVQQAIFRFDGAADPGVIYLPTAQEELGASFLLVRAGLDPASLAEPLRSTVQRLDPDVALAQVLTLEEVLDQIFAGIRIFNVILTGFGIMALLLASLGVYGVLAYSVTRRRREIGLRMAVGAAAPQVLGMFLGEGVRVGAVGIVLGGLLTLPVGMLIRSAFQGLSTIQWSALVLSGAALFGATLLASFLSASAATRVDPIRSLSAE